MTTTETVRRYLIYFGIFIAVVVLLQICLNSLKRSPIVPGGDDPELLNAYKQAGEGLELITPPSLTTTSITISERSTPIFNVDNQFTQPSYQALNLYKVEQPRERFGTETKAKDIAEKFGFKNLEPERLNSGASTTNDKGLLVWRQNSKLYKYNKVTQELDYSNSFAVPKGSEALFNNNETALKDEAKKLIDRLALNRSSLDFTTMQLDYLNRKGSTTFNVATSPNTAEYLKIRVYRRLEAASLKVNEKGEVPNEIKGKAEPISANVVSENHQAAPLEIIIAGNGAALSLEQLYSAKFTDWNILTDTPIVYPALTPAEAWEQVKQGRGSLQELVEFGFDRLQTGKAADKEVLSFTANYLEVELAYLEYNDWQGYLFPIYIFKGRAKLSNSPSQDNANFVFYAYAIKPK